MNKDETRKQLGVYIHNLALVTNDLAEYLGILKRNNIEFDEKIIDEVTKIQDAIVQLDQLI